MVNSQSFLARDVREQESKGKLVPTSGLTNERNIIATIKV